MVGGNFSTSWATPRPSVPTHGDFPVRAGGTPHIFTVLEIPPVESPEQAVQAVLAGAA